MDALQLLRSALAIAPLLIPAARAEAATAPTGAIEAGVSLERWGGAPPRAWSDALAGRAAELEDPSACGPAAACVRPEWRAMIASLADAPLDVKIVGVQRWLNSRPYRPDAPRRDDWSSPERFLAEGGDCEDYAVAKYFALRKLGVPSQDLKITIVRERGARQDHAVLLVGQGGEARVLDNREDDVRRIDAARPWRVKVAVDEAAAWVEPAPKLARRSPGRSFSIAAALDAHARPAPSKRSRLALR